MNQVIHWEKFSHQAIPCGNFSVGPVDRETMEQEFGTALFCGTNEETSLLMPRFPKLVRPVMGWYPTLEVGEKILFYLPEGPSFISVLERTR